MAKSWSEKPLWEKAFMAGDHAYLLAGKIVGHLGCSPSEFLEQAKLLPDYNQYRYENAVRDLTDYGKREAKPPRYVLTPTAKKVLRPIIGPEPTAADYRSWWASRLVSVKAMRDEGKEPKWAAEPPVPLQEEKQPAEPQPKPARKPRERKKAG